MPRGTGVACSRASACRRACPPTAIRPRMRRDRCSTSRTATRLPRRSRAARENARQVREQISVRDVAADQPPVPLGEARRARPRLDRPHARLPDVGHRRRASLPGHHQRDDDARRRVAVHRARTLCRARRRHSGAARSPLQRFPGPVDDGRGRRVRRVGGPAALVLRLRGVLPALHRRPAVGSDRRVPDSQRAIPTVGAVRRDASRRRCRPSRS